MIRNILLFLILAVATCQLLLTWPIFQSSSTNESTQSDTNNIGLVINSNEELKKLDEEVESYFSKLKKSNNHTELPSEFTTEQKKWLGEREKQCGSLDVECLTKYYQARLFSLTTTHDNLVPYALTELASFQGIKNRCSFSDIDFPENLQIYAGGAYSGRKTKFQIDQSGHQATQFEVLVNSPENPVALILGAYEPSIWNIAWTPNTQIKAVVITGYHKQAVAGLPNDTPILNSSYDNKGPCGYLYITERDSSKLHPLSERVYGTGVHKVNIAQKGKLVFGEPITLKTKLFTSQDTPVNLLISQKVLAGELGLKDLVNKGGLRRSTPEDLEKWAQRKLDLHKGALSQDETKFNVTSFKPKYVHNGYVILDKIMIPAGLYGGNSATFFLEQGISYPEGKLGHSTLYDFNTMSCHGVQCSNMSLCAAGGCSAPSMGAQTLNTTEKPKLGQ